MKLKRLSVAVSLVGLAVSVGLLAAVLWDGMPAGAESAAVTTADPVAAYRLEKLNDVNDMVLKRAVVPEDYLYYVEDTALRDALKTYNEQTGTMHLYYQQRGMDIANALFYEHKETPGDYDQPMLYYEWVGRIAGHALYRNTTQLCYADPFLGYPLAKEAGGSYGMWAYQLHNPGFSANAEESASAEAYFALVDDLLVRLEDARRAMG